MKSTSLMYGATTAFGALMLGGCSYGSAGGLDPLPAALEPVTVTAPPVRDPSELQVLFWSDEQRSDRFRDMESWFAGHEVPAATTPRALVQGEPLPDALAQEIRQTMADTGASGVMVHKGGSVRFEEYGLGFAPDQRWTSFSVAKSFTSTLLGAAVRDGFIAKHPDLKPILEKALSLQ